MIKFPYHIYSFDTIINSLRQVHRELTSSFINSKARTWGVCYLPKTHSYEATQTKYFDSKSSEFCPFESMIFFLFIDFQLVDVQPNSKWLLPSRNISKCQDHRSFPNTHLNLNGVSTDIDTCRPKTSNCLCQVEIKRQMC